MTCRLNPVYGVFLTALTMAACQENLAAPADCPALCPAGEVVVDTILSPVMGGDTSFAGFIIAGAGNSLRVSNGLAASEDRAAMRFFPRGDSVLVPGDSNRAYTVDSILLAVSVLARDTTVKNLYVYFYRLPSSLDSSANFASVDGAMVPGNLIDSVLMADTLATGRITTMLRAPLPPTLDFAASDSTRLAIGIRIQANSPTGVRIGSSGAGASAPTFVSYVTAAEADTTKRKQVMTRSVEFNTFVSQSTAPLNPDLLTVGGSPSSRALLRFVLPPFIKDSALLVRATLELTPSAPILGLPGDSAGVQAFGLLADFGQKSPSGSPRGLTQLVLGSVDTVRIDIVGLVKNWQGTNPLPAGLFVAIAPEGSSFATPVFFSTRSPAGQPRLHVTYTLRFPFERP